MTVKGKGGSPRRDYVPETLGICPKHGQVLFRTHKVGLDRHGAQRYRRRCPECHANRNHGRA